MKNYRKIILIIIATIIVYAIFLLVTDINKIIDKIINFNIIYAPFIVGLVICSWMIVYYRWHLMLKLLGINIPHKSNFQIFLIGTSLGITPGKMGELFKSQILKDKYNIPRTKTAPIFLLEKFLDLSSALVISSIGIIFFPEMAYLVGGGLLLVFLIIKIFSSKNFFQKFIHFIEKFNFFKKYSESISSSQEIFSDIIRKKEVIIFGLLSMAYWIVIGSAAYLILLGLGFESLSILNVISSYSISLVIGALSLIPGGIGVAEASLVGLLTLQNIQFSDAVVAVVLIRLFTLWFSTISGFITLKTSKTL
jgi:glycosyltransferase 2 family protein